jgi:hypothetical protein
MWKSTLLSLAIGIVYCGPINAQGKAGLLKGLQGNNDMDNQRKDFEGFIWEYKVMQHDETDRSKKTNMTGRLRLKQTALFAVGEVEYAANKDEEEKDENKAGTENEPSASPASNLKKRMQGKQPSVQGEGGQDIKEQVKGVVSQRLKQQSEEQTGSERIGDLIKQLAKEYTFRFDEDDDYPLSGLAVVQPDATAKGGVWRGYYDEFEDGKKKKRWRFELRKIEE